MDSTKSNSLLLLSNNVQFQQFENLPSDYVFNGSETVETFVVRGDLVFNLDDENTGWTQELLPENQTQVNTPIDCTSDVQPTEKKLTRKRARNPTKWKSNVAKVNRQSGKPYTTKKGEKRPGKFVKSMGCANELTCPFQCMSKIDQAARQAIYDSYWGLDDKEKRHFYASNVKKVGCLRKRTKAETSQKPYSLNYYFNYMEVDIRVCQRFFINTLNVNKGRVYYFFKQSKSRPTITPGPLMHGKHKKKVLSEVRKQEVRDHINKFPTMESHYCRQNTKKQYLDQGLNLTQMYRLYATESDNPVKLSAYRNIFNYEFNLAFFRPKKDRCDKCVEYELLQEPNEQQVIEYAHHYEKKTYAHNERNNDRDVDPEIRKQNKSGVADFDLENVFQLPIANASILFYLRKFSEYNLTVAINKIVYNVLWNEFCCGRAGTHLASALVKALKQIVIDNPEMEQLTLWSDSCVPQNRNSYMSAAIQEFLNSNHSGNLHSIDHKYSEAGHGEVQDIDSAHSVIENFLRGKFIYSPVSLLKEFHKIPTGKFTFIVLEMENSDYFDYQSLAQASKYSVIPYKKLVQLTYKKNHSEISFKLGYNEDFIATDILLKHNYTSAPVLQELELHSTITAGKMADIQKMYGIMPEIDRTYYQNEFRNLLESFPAKVNTSATTSNPEIEGPVSIPKISKRTNGTSSQRVQKSRNPKASMGTVESSGQSVPKSRISKAAIRETGSSGQRVQTTKSPAAAICPTASSTQNVRKSKISSTVVGETGISGQRVQTTRSPADAICPAASSTQNVRKSKISSTAVGVIGMSGQLVQTTKSPADAICPAASSTQNVRKSKILSTTVGETGISVQRVQTTKSPADAICAAASSTQNVRKSKISTTAVGETGSSGQRVQTTKSPADAICAAASSTQNVRKSKISTTAVGETGSSGQLVQTTKSPAAAICPTASSTQNVRKSKILSTTVGETGISVQRVQTTKSPADAICAAASSTQNVRKSKISSTAVGETGISGQRVQTTRSPADAICPAASSTQNVRKSKISSTAVGVIGMSVQRVQTTKGPADAICAAASSTQNVRKSKMSTTAVGETGSSGQRVQTTKSPAAAIRPTASSTQNVRKSKISTTAVGETGSSGQRVQTTKSPADAICPGKIGSYTEILYATIGGRSGNSGDTHLLTSKRKIDTGDDFEEDVSANELRASRIRNRTKKLCTNIETTETAATSTGRLQSEERQNTELRTSKTRNRNTKLCTTVEPTETEATSTGRLRAQERQKTERGRAANRQKQSN